VVSAELLLSRVVATGEPAVTRRQLAADLIADVRDLDRRIVEVEARISTAIAESKTTLVELFGVGPVLAARFLGEVGDVGRFPTKHHFAAHTVTAPLEASSGQKEALGCLKRRLSDAVYRCLVADQRRQMELPGQGLDLAGQRWPAGCLQVAAG
jgi:transposase